jgi:predicted ATPase/class 3 adenylate cyclase
MQICTLCGYENPDDVSICLNCASKIGQLCPSCGNVIPSTSKICPRCATTLTDIPQGVAPPRAFSQSITSKQEKMLLELRGKIPAALKLKIDSSTLDHIGQRREITVVVVEIYYSSAFSKTLDSEDLYLLTEQIMHLLVDVIYKYEGTLDKLSKDGLVSLFGIPLNHENDPERAVRASLEMHTAIQKLKEQSALKQIDFDLKIGINTGQVIAGSLGSDYHMDYTILGDTVNLAKSLQEIAEPGTTLVSFQTYQRTNPIFEFRAASQNKTSGLADSVELYTPTKIREKPGRIRGLPGLQVPMVGRSEDLKKMQDALTYVVKEKDFQVFLINGDAGLGKSRLVEEFRLSLFGQPIRIYLGTCASYMRITPYRVISNIVRDVLRVSEGDLEELQRNALKAYLSRNNLDKNDVLPFLLYVLDLPQDDPVAESRLRLLSPTMLQHQIHSALRLFLIAEAGLATLVLIFDDLHWIDPASADFLRYFVQAIDGIAVLLIMIARTGLDQPALQIETQEYLSAKGNLHILDLKPLLADQTHILVDRLIAESSDTANEIKKQIVIKSAGNPYYAEELVRILIDYGGLLQQDHRWCVTSQAEKILQTVPGTLQDIILARFDSLPAELRTLTQKVAVIGQSFIVNHLKTFVEMNEERLYEKLLELEKRDFIICSSIKGEIIVYFKHPLIREVVYDTLFRKDLRRFHLRIAEVIEGNPQFFPGERNEILGYHYAESSSPEKAIPYLFAAAESALLRFANRNAIGHYRQLISLLEKYPTQSSKIEFKSVPVGLGKALKFTGEFQEAKSCLKKGVNELLAEECYRQAPSGLQFLIDGFCELADLSTREGSFDEAMDSLQKGMEILGEAGYEQQPVLWRRLADRIAWVYFREGKLEEAFRQADLALFDVSHWEQDDPIVLASLNNTLGGIYWMRNSYAEAIRHVESSLQINKNLGYAWGMAIAYTNMGVLYFSQEDWPKAVANFELADALQKEHGYTLERPTNLKNLGETLICMGDFSHAREVLETSLEISQRLGMNPAIVYSHLGLCRLAVHEEEFHQAQAHLETIEKLTNPSIIDERHVQILTLKAIIYAKGGDYQEGLEIATSACRIAKEMDLLTEEVEALRINGVINTHLKDFEQAEEQLHTSLDLAEDQKDHYQQALALYELGQCYVAQALEDTLRAEGLAVKARQVYKQAIEYFEELGAKHDLLKAQGALNQLPFLHRQVKYSTTSESGDHLESSAPTLMRDRTPVGEKYQTTVIHLKFVSRGDEDKDFVNETFALLVPPVIEIFQEHKGYVIRHQDGLTVLFGAPVKYENDAEFAIESAMQIVNHFQELNNQIDSPISFKLAVTMGEIVGGLVDFGLEQSFIATGEAIDQAYELVDEVRLAQVWVTQPVRNATAHRFTYRAIASDLTDRVLRQEVAQLVGLREQMRPVRGLIGVKTPFIGRITELNVMKALEEKLDLNQGGLIWIEGEAGIGKSRLMREYANWLGDRRPIQVWNGACISRRSERAFSLFSDLFYHVFELQPTFTAEQNNFYIDRKLGTWPEELQSIRPFLQFLLGLQPTGTLGEMITAWEPEQLRRQTFVQLRRLLSAMTARSPLLLLLDDLQWIDSISADLLLFLSYLTTTNPLLIVGTKRSTETSASESTLTQIKAIHSDRTKSLLIQPLTTDESLELLQGILSPSDMPGQILTLIIQQSSGNPYYIEEFIRMLLEQNYLHLGRGGLEINWELEISRLGIPSSLEAVIRSRVDSLPNTPRKLIQSAAVIGQTFNLDLLVNVSRVAHIEPQMDILRSRGMLVQDPDKGSWHFSHPLIEVTTYNAILRVQRRALHSRAARALEMQWRGDEAEHAEDLAYHYQRADESDKAIIYLIMAGEREAARFGNEQALTLFEQANELLTGQSQPRDEDRWRIAIGMGSVYLLIGNYDASIAALQSGLEVISKSMLSNAQQAELYRLLGEAMQRKGDQEAALRYLTQALEVLGAPSDTQSEVEAARIQARLGWSNFLSGYTDKAEKACRDALVWASRAGNPNALATVENLLGGIYYRQGDFSQASVHTRQAMLNWEEIGYTWGVATSLGNLGILEASAGNWEEAQANLQKCLESYQQIGDVESIARAHNNLGNLARDRGQLDTAVAHFQNSLAVAKPYQMAWHTANSTNGLAQSLLYKGQLEEAGKALQEGIAIAEEIKAQNILAEMCLTQTEYLLARHDLEKAGEQAMIAAHLANETGNPLVEAGAWRVMSECQRQRGELENARQALEKAWQALSDSSDQLETGRIHAQAAKVELDLNNPVRARDHLGVAQEIFTRLGAAYDLALLQPMVEFMG